MAVEHITCARGKEFKKLPTLRINLTVKLSHFEKAAQGSIITGEEQKKLPVMRRPLFSSCI